MILKICRVINQQYPFRSLNKLHYVLLIALGWISHSVSTRCTASVFQNPSCCIFKIALKIGSKGSKNRHTINFRWRAVRWHCPPLPCEVWREVAVMYIAGKAAFDAVIISGSVWDIEMDKVANTAVLHPIHHKMGALCLLGVWAGWSFSCLFFSHVEKLFWAHFMFLKFPQTGLLESFLKVVWSLIQLCCMISSERL